MNDDYEIELLDRLISGMQDIGKEEKEALDKIRHDETGTIAPIPLNPSPVYTPNELPKIPQVKTG